MKKGLLVGIVIEVILLVCTITMLAALAQRVMQTKPTAATFSVGADGTTVLKDDLELVSSYPSNDIIDGTDGTSRLILQSYQRANVNSFGEVMRVYLMRNDAKAMQAYYIPKMGYNPDGSAHADLNPDGTIADITQWRSVSWNGAHYTANDGQSNHAHWSVEVPDSTGAMQTRLEVPFADQTTGEVGVDKTVIMTNLADFAVRCTNDQVFRLSAPRGDDMEIEFNHASNGNLVDRRWVIRANNAEESGNNKGTDFQVLNCDDTGEILSLALNIDRQTGNTTLGGGSAPSDVKLDVRGDSIRIAEPKTPASSMAPGTAGQICWDEDYMYICVEENTWKRMELSAW